MAMTFSLILLLSLSAQVFAQSCSFSWPPPNTFAGPKPIFVNGDTLTANWTSGFDEVGLVLWNDWHSAQNTEGIDRFLQGASPDPGTWSGKLDVSLDQGSSFHLVLYSTKDKKELGPQCDTISFEIIDPSAADQGTEAGASSVIASILATAQLTGSTAPPSSMPTAFPSDTAYSYTVTPSAEASFTASPSAGTLPSALPSEVPSSLLASLIAAASNEAAAAQASKDAAYYNANSGSLPQGAVVGLGVGLGLGIPAFIATTIALTLCFARRRSRGGSSSAHENRDMATAETAPAETRTEAGTRAGTAMSTRAGAAEARAGSRADSRAAGTVSRNGGRGPLLTPTGGPIVVERYA